MNRRQFALGSAASGLLFKNTSKTANETHPGIWRLSFGVAEDATPVRTRHYQPAVGGLAQLPRLTACPVNLSQVSGTASGRGYQVSLPLEPGELVYGFGLQFQSFMQRGLKKSLRVNADPKLDTGDSHAPVPFYVTTRGYGILVDTLRYATFYCGNKDRKGTVRAAKPAAAKLPAIASLPAEYARFHVEEASEMLIEIPRARGVDIYIFGGPGMRDAVQRYNLFAGGGALPPRWGLGFWYRCDLEFDQDQVVTTAEEFRQRNIPCDVLGLEPGWQTHAYSCSYVWSGKFPNPAAMLAKLGERNYYLNLWEHAFTHPSSPIHGPLQPFSGDYEVWDGLVPDFVNPEARQIFAAFHDKEHVSLGVSGYKLDECDNSDFTGNWSFPELTRFPSGVDGEQMHCSFGLRYQDAIQSIFERRKLRTLSLVRSSHALASAYPFVLYSDLYDHREFIRALVNAGFCGLLWCPEVRDAQTGEDLIRRLQTAVFSPLTMVNAWYIKNPPWKQVNADKNNAGDFSPGWEQLETACRNLINLRMQLIPYLYSAFVRYQLEGLPPFRALVMDFPTDPQTWTIDNQYLVGESLLVAPVVASERERSVYLPEGNWFDFWSGKSVTGKQLIQVAPPLEQIPVFVRDGSLLPLARITPHATDSRAFELSVRVYGNGDRAAVLFEDNGEPAPQFNRLTLQWNARDQAGTASRTGTAGGATAYQVTKWERVTASPNDR